MAADHQRVLPLPAPHARLRLARSRSTAGASSSHAHKISQVVEQDRRHQQELHRVAVDHGVAGDEGAGQQAVAHALVHALALCRVMRLARSRLGPARNQEHAAHHTSDAGHANAG